MNTCHIKYCGKDENGIDRYWCLTHKDVASDKDGHLLKECLCNYKKIYDNKLKIEPRNIESIKVIYKNALEEIKPIIYLNKKPTNRVHHSFRPLSIFRVAARKFNDRTDVKEERR